MLAQALLAAVERDLSVARQLAHYHVDLSGSGGIRSADDVAADESGAATNPFHFATCSAAFPLAHSRHSASTAAAAAAPPSTSPAATPACAASSGKDSSSAAAAVPLRVVLSNAVQRPRQGTCAVLMELSRPLPWLSQRGRYRSSAVTGGTRGTAGSTATMSTSGGAAPSTAAGGGGAGAAAGHGTGSSAVFGAPGSGAASASSGGGAVGGLHGSNSTTSAAAASATAASSSPGVPLLIATATLEVVFPARYPSEPCYWHLSEEVSFGGMGDHSTSSWAVTAGHIRGNTTGASGGNGNSSGSTGGSPRFPLPHHPHPGVGGRGNSRAWYGAGGGGGEGAGPAASQGGSSSGVAHSAAAEDNAAVPTLTAFVVPEVGRRLLRWIAEARVGAADSSTSTAAPLTPPREAWDSAADTPQHRRGTRLHHTDVSPFLLDFAVLLRCWSSVEVDVHHLVLPSRIALAYGGGGGARMLRTMTGTHLSGGAAAGAAVAGAAGAVSGGGGLLASAGAPLQVASGVAGGGGVTALPAAASVGGTTSSTASVPAPAQSGTTSIGASGSLGGGLSAVSAGGGGGGAGPAPPAVAGPSAGVGPVVSGAAAASGASAGGVSVLYPYRRLPVKSFMALLLPLGEVAVWGTPLPARRAVHLADSGAAAPAWLPARRLPPVLRQLYESARHGALRPTSVAVSCTTQFTLGKVLPTYVLPCHVLGTPYKCDWDAVRLFTGKSADAALHAHAKLAKALRLPDVSDLLQVLRRLSKNVGAPSTGVLYISAVVWPALMEAVRVLRDGRLPFWGGLAACSLLLLPGVLQQDSKSDAAEGGSGSRSRGCASVSIVPDESAAPAPWRRRHLAELIEVVTYVEHVLALAREHTLLCEARLVRCALQRGLHLVQQCSDAAVGPHTTTLWPTATGAAAAAALTTPGKSAPAVERGAAMGAAASAVTALVTPFTPIVIASADMCRRLHAPITTCAVCGLSLLGSTVTTADVGGGGMSAAGLSRAPTNADAVRFTLKARRVEGCLVVQCARCGHGGHVEHISSWWNDPTVRCCPKGCDCRCTY